MDCKYTLNGESSTFLEFLTRCQNELHKGTQAAKAEESVHESFSKVNNPGAISEALIKLNCTFPYGGKGPSWKSVTGNYILFSSGKACSLTVVGISKATLLLCAWLAIAHNIIISI